MLEKLPRIVSLLPAATEIVCALGAASGLVGVSHECDFPEAIRGLEVLTASRIGNDSTSAAIDAVVRALVHDALSIYSVDEARLASLAPDLALTQDLCQVCAVSLDDVRSAVARLAHRKDVQIVSLPPTRLEHVLQGAGPACAGLGRSRVPRLCDRRQRILQSPRTASGGVARDPSGVHSARPICRFCAEASASAATLGRA